MSTATRPAEQLIPTGRRNCEVKAGRHRVRLTNLQKPFWPEEGITKGDLLRYYAAVSGWLLPHLRDRAMVLKRYPNGIHGKFFFMKRVPQHAPDWVRGCTIPHPSDPELTFPVVHDLPSLLWAVNLGSIDLNPWYARCEAYDQPDFLHFDLDPVPGADFGRVRETALLLREALEALRMRPYAKTTGSKGIHVYVAIRRGPVQKEVWRFAKALALTLAGDHPGLITGEYRVAKRPKGRVLVDYNQNSWGSTLASVYSVRPKPGATVSMPITWEEVEDGVEIEDFTLRNAPARLAEVGDLWRPLLYDRGRFDLEKLL